VAGADVASELDPVAQALQVTDADLDARRTAPLPAEFAAQLDRVIAEHSRLAWPAPVCGVMSV
jgi:hypothetical protein